MINRVEWKKYSWVLFAVMGACVIFGYYAKYVLCINTVWSLVDEYGYLINAAYLSGTNWTSLTTLYYGWGYSLLLVPLFLIGAKGTTIIRGAILINAFCVVGTYLVQIALLSKICKQLNKYIVILVAFVLSFYPFVMTSATIVMPDSLLMFMVWLSGLVLYQALTTKRMRWYCFLSFLLAYSFFVHTRSIVFIGTWLLLLLIMLVFKEVDWKQLVILLVLFALFYIAGYAVKNLLITEVYSKALGTDLSEGTASVGNILPVGFVFSRIMSIFSEQVFIYMKSFLCKFFYVSVATLGTWQLGVCSAVKTCMDKWRQRVVLSPAEWIKVCFALASFMMLCATAIQSPGRTNAVGYYFYGRYHEYLVLPVVAIGIEYFMCTKIKWKEYLFHIVAVIISSVVALSLYPILEKKLVSLDTARMSAFSALASERDYRELVLGYLAITVVWMLVGALINNKKSFRWTFMVLIMTMFAFNNWTISSLVTNISSDVYGDNLIAEYVLENVDTGYVYYLDGENVIYTTRMQVLLGQKQLAVIEIDDIQALSGCYLLAQTGSRYEEVLSEFENVLTGYYYALYYVE